MRREHGAGCRDYPCWVSQGQKARSNTSPVNLVEVFLEVAVIHSTLAELQLCLGVVVHVVDTHLLQDSKTSLEERRSVSPQHVTLNRLSACSFLMSAYYPVHSSAYSRMCVTQAPRMEPGGRSPSLAPASGRRDRDPVNKHQKVMGKQKQRQSFVLAIRAKATKP